MITGQQAIENLKANWAMLPPEIKARFTPEGLYRHPTQGLMNPMEARELDQWTGASHMAYQVPGEASQNIWTLGPQGLYWQGPGPAPLGGQPNINQFTSGRPVNFATGTYMPSVGASMAGQSAWGNAAQQNRAPMFFGQQGQQPQQPQQPPPVQGPINRQPEARQPIGRNDTGRAGMLGGGAQPRQAPPIGASIAGPTAAPQRPLVQPPGMGGFMMPQQAAPLPAFQPGTAQIQAILDRLRGGGIR